MTDDLHPNIGGKVFINPGTGNVKGADEWNARKNIKAFVKELGLQGVRWRRIAAFDYGNGRYAFMLYYNGRRIDVQMPGWELGRVRFMDRPEQNVWDFPRLYVGGDSWLWMFAIDTAKRVLTKDEDE